MRLRGARVGGDLYCNRAQLHNETGPALHAARLEVDGSVHLEELHATGHGDDGAVRLFGARIGNLFCSGAQLHNDAGPALNAEGLQVGGTVWLHDGFRATGHGEDGAVQNLIGVAPEEDRDVVAEVVRSVFGRQFTPLALGRQV